MEFTYFLGLCVAFFTVVGFLRGFHKEFIGFTGIVISLFVIAKFFWVFDFFLSSTNATTRFIVEALILIYLTYVSYEQAPSSFAPARYRNRSGIVNLPGPDYWQLRVLGAVFGGFNGYLVVGSLWYLMDQLEYPLDPLFAQPLIGSDSAAFVDNLPLVWLQQGDILLGIIVVIAAIIIYSR